MSGTRLFDALWRNSLIDNQCGEDPALDYPLTGVRVVGEAD